MTEEIRLNEAGLFPGMDDMTDESASKILPDMLRVLSHADSPVFPKVIQFLRKRENIVFPYVSDILQSSDGNSKYCFGSFFLHPLRSELQRIRAATI